MTWGKGYMPRLVQEKYNMGPEHLIEPESNGGGQRIERTAEPA